MRPNHPLLQILKDNPQMSVAEFARIYNARVK